MQTHVLTAQVTAIQELYAVHPDELTEARAILAGDSPAVFAVGASMCEPATHRRWAEATIRRAECFGLRPDALAAAV